MTKFFVWKISPNIPPIPLEVSEKWRTLDDVSESLPGGAYTTFRTYEGFKVLNFTDHTTRLERTAQLSGQPVILNIDKLRADLHEIIHAVPFTEKRLRVTLDLENDPGTVYIAVEELVTPPLSAYQQGVKVITRRLERSNPQAKLTTFISTAAMIRSEIPLDVNEVIMVDGMDHLLEGLSSNFFVVFRRQLWTAGEGVLLGGTRKVVLEITKLLEIPIRLEAQHLTDVTNFEEAFITSVSRSVLPVTQINDHVLGDGKVGSITRQIMLAFENRVKHEAELI